MVSEVQLIWHFVKEMHSAQSQREENGKMY